MSLDWILLSSKTIQARLCFAPPDGKDWRLVSPTIQLGADPKPAGLRERSSGLQTITYH